MSDFGFKLRLAREKAGLHMREVAEHLGVSTPEVCDIERGRKRPDGETAGKILALLGLEPDEYEELRILWERS